MLRQGPLSMTVHSLAEPFLALVLIGAPFALGFDSVGAPTALSIVAGVLVLVVAMSTCWRLSLVKVLPVVAHAAIDLVLGVLLLASPFLFAYRGDSGAATAFFIVLGVGLILGALGTRWDPDDQIGPPRGRRRRQTPAPEA